MESYNGTGQAVWKYARAGERRQKQKKIRAVRCMLNKFQAINSLVIIEFVAFYCR